MFIYIAPVEMTFGMCLTMHFIFLACFFTIYISGRRMMFDMNGRLGCVFMAFLCKLGMMLFSSYVLWILVDLSMSMNIQRTTGKARLDFARVLITTTQLEIVNTTSEFFIDGSKYVLKTVEEWGCNLGEDAFLTEVDSLTEPEALPQYNIVP